MKPIRIILTAALLLGAAAMQTSAMEESRDYTVGAAPAAERQMPAVSIRETLEYLGDREQLEPPAGFEPDLREPELPTGAIDGRRTADQPRW